MPEFSPRVMELLSSRYLRGEETPDELLDRAAFGCSRTVSDYKAFKKMIDALDFMPSTPILMNSTSNIPSLFACYTLGVQDDLENIMETAKTCARIFKYGGGVGINMSDIRPRGSVVRTTDTFASGAVSFLEIFNAVGEVVKQGSRRAAILASLDIEHGDIEEFLLAKHLSHTDENHLKNMNISVLVRDEFMDKVFQKGNAEYDQANARLDMVCESIWSSGEPGLIFMDIAEESSPLTGIDPLVTGNACSELIMTDREACCLGSINLNNMIKDDGSIDTPKLRRTIKHGVKFLDNVISTSVYPTPEIESKVKLYRRIGLGVMGLHSALIKMGLQYDSEEGRDAVESIMGFIDTVSIQASEDLAEKDGSFPGYTKDMGFAPRRNISVTCCPPTGTTSMIAGGTGVISSGIEPFFDQEYYKDVVGGENHQVEEGVHCALDISMQDHIKMLETIQQCIGSAVSKTINCPESTTKEEIKEAIINMYKCRVVKSCAFYRNNSRNIQILNSLKEGNCKNGTCDL